MDMDADLCLFFESAYAPEDFASMDRDEPSTIENPSQI
jgi:hypothetical protein